MKKLIIKIKFESDNRYFQDIGTSYIHTNNQLVIHEIRQYKCPIRLSDYIDGVLEDDNGTKEILKTPDAYDFEIDLSEVSEKICTDFFKDKIDFGKYLLNTSHLDKYGAE